MSTFPVLPRFRIPVEHWIEMLESPNYFFLSTIDSSNCKCLSLDKAFFMRNNKLRRSSYIKAFIPTIYTNLVKFDPHMTSHLSSTIFVSPEVAIGYHPLTKGINNKIDIQTGPMMFAASLLILDRVPKIVMRRFTHLLGVYCMS